MSSQGDGLHAWRDIAAEAELSADETTTLEEALLPIAAPDEPGTAAMHRLAQRVWVEARRRPAGSAGRRIGDLLTVGRAQLNLFRPAFWIVSIVAMSAGAAATAVGLDPGRTISFYLAAPLLAYAATWTAFRGQSLGLQELELSSPVSARELLLLRLFLILACDIGIGLAASLPLAITSVPGLDRIILAWLCPLILAVGATLLVASWTAVERAGALVYAAWVTSVVTVARVTVISASSLLTIDLIIGAIGLALVTTIVATVPGRFALTPRMRRA